MSKLTIDGKAYESESLSPKVHEQIANVRLVDQEIARLRIQIAIAQTARLAYSNALKLLLPDDGVQAPTALERAMAAGEYLDLG